MKHLLDNAQGLRPLEAFGCPPGLPIYRLRQETQSIYYTPGLVAAVTHECDGDLQNLLEEKSAPGASIELTGLASEIRQHALDSRAKYFSLQTSPFEPECLTLHLHNQCNLNCEYCLRKKRTNDGETLHPEEVSAGVRFVAQNCRDKGIPLTVVFHGWGEPAYDFSLLEVLVKAVEREAGRTGVQQFRYIATNGVLPPEVVEYLCRHFHLIGLSCDGPPEIQDAQRPLKNAAPTSNFVEQTASILKQNGSRFSVRATITRSTMRRQEEIAGYIVKRLGPEEIYFEPAYRAGNTFLAEDADEFFEHFQKAHALASAHGVRLIFSGSRLQEIHGPHCNVFRNVLNLVPGNGATACFLSGSREGRYRIGERRNGDFYIDGGRIGCLKTTLMHAPDECRHCFNHFHCVGLCPEICALDSEKVQQSHKKTFRCRLQLLIAAEQIFKTAKKIEKNTGLARFNISSTFFDRRQKR